MQALLRKLREIPRVTVGVVTAQPVRNMTYRAVDGIDSFVVPQGWQSFELGRRRALRRCAEVVTDWSPDLLHFHGTERLYGLLTARKMVDTPAVISLQGLLGPYSEWRHFFGNASMAEIIRAHRLVEPLAFRGIVFDYMKLRSAAQVERKIIQGNCRFMGRTLWDRAYIAALNPAAAYHHVGELLREPFWETQWNLDDCQRYRLIFTNAGHPRKGTKCLLDAVRIIAQKRPEVEVCVAGTISKRSGYGRYVRRLLMSLGNRGIELGPLNAHEMTNELTKSHVFVSPSFIDNSPNAIGEAQLVGVPVVSTYTGGVPSMVEHGKTGLFVPTGDPSTLAATIQNLFDNDSLANRLSNGGRQAAIHRHQPETVVNQLMDAYGQALKCGESIR